MPASDHYSAIIVGTGAGGGTSAHTLAAAGTRILLLERDDFLPRETENWHPAPAFVDGRYISPEEITHVDTSLFPSIGAVKPALTAMANAVRVGEHLIERLG
ncbi:hypothetical protein ACFYO7_10245 [Nocardia salmonicida]|uniref:hypothetical protein n=1 Tax=Nocardia salmonicida TaxID=53431 RepID=UPI0036B56BB5